MPLAYSSQTSFVAGELDPGLIARVDLDSYYKGAATLTNLDVIPQGGIKRRPGLEYVATTPSSNVVKKVPFEFNDEQKYLIVFSAARMDVYADDVLVDTVTTGHITNLTEAMLASLDWTQSADTMYITHADLQTAKITRTGASTFTFTAVTFNNIPTFDFGSGAEAVISATRGWPVSCTFHQTRLVLAGLSSRPQTILMSKVGSYEDLNTTAATADYAIDITINSNQACAIRRCYSGRHLQIFTTGGEFYIPSGLDSAPITPDSVSVIPQTSHGSGYLKPVSVDGATLFFDGKDLREFLFKDVELSYIATSLSILATHMLSGCIAMALRKTISASSANYVYMVNSDGTVGVLNSLRNEGITAWSRWTTDGTFEDVCVVGDDVYFTVKRNINGGDVRYIEKANSSLKTDAAKSQTVGTATTAWSGLSHLEGETVKAIGNNFIMEDAVIASGATTSSEEVLTAEFGLDFAFELVTMPFNLPDQGGTIVGKRKRKVSIKLNLSDTRNILVDGWRPPYTPIGEVFSGEPSYMNGWYKVNLGGIDEDAQVTITQDQPLDFEMYGYVLEVKV